jgi:FkbM family methyltransferase
MNYLNDKFVNIFDKNKDDFKIIFEVGCRDCLDTINLSKYFKNSHIYGFECNPDMINTCLNNLNNYEYKNKITFFDYGLGDKETELNFYSYVVGNPGASSFYKRIDFNHTQIDKGKTKLRTIYDIVNEKKIEKIDLLCMDVQGFELNILKGCKDFIKNINYIIIEEPRKIISEMYLPKGLHSKYIDAPNAYEIQNYLSSNNFKEISRTYENELEDNVMYKNNLI